MFQTLTRGTKLDQEKGLDDPMAGVRLMCDFHWPTEVENVRGRRVGERGLIGVTPPVA